MKIIDHAIVKSDRLKTIK